MADKSVGELIAAQSVTPTDLFVLEQNGTAKKLTGQILENWLVSFADGHGGINKIEKLRSSGLVDTYRITLADTTTFDFTVNNGKSITGISKTGTQGLVDTYTITYNDDQSTTFKVTNGAKGDKGDNAYTWIKYASQKPQESSHSMGDVPDNWIGVYTGNKSSAPSDWKEYKWFQWKGNTGNTGDPARLVSQEVKYQVGDSGSIIPSGNWQSNVPVTPQGKYLWVRTTLTFNSGSPVVSYAVSHQGLDGSGSVSSVAGISPDPQGNVPLSAADVGALATTGGSMTGPIEMNGQPISGLNPPKTETEPVTKGDGNARYLQKAGGTMAGPIDMAGQGLQNLPLPTDDKDPLVKGQVVNNFTTTEPGFVADARTVKELNDASKTKMEFHTLSSSDGRYYKCKIRSKGAKNARIPFVVIKNRQNTGPTISAAFITPSGSFVSSDNALSYSSGVLTIDCGQDGWADNLILYNPNSYDIIGV